MRILSRYILREVITHALLGGGVFTFVIFMRDLGRLLDLVVRNSAPLPSVAEIFFLTVPTALTVTIPMGVLVGILIGLSRLAADSEITAMRASGIGVFLFVQTLGLMVVLAWGLATLNTVFVAPRSAAALADLQARLKSSQVSFEVQPRVFYEDFKNYVLYVEDASASESAAAWRKIFLVDISTPNAPKITLAEEGVLVSESPQSLHLHLLNGSTHETDPRQPDQYSISTFSESDFPIPIPPPENKAGQFAPIAQLTTGQLMHDARGLQAAAKSNPQGVDATRLRWYSIELHRRFALPAACLVLAAVGIPLGLSAKKGGKATGFVLTIALVFVYYFISLGGVSMARQDTLSPGLGVWIGNLVFFAAGVGLLLLADRRPLEVGFGSFWASLKQFFRRDRRSAQDVAEKVIIRRRFFSANFPQILDDYVLRDFVLYLALVLATFIILTLVFTFFELLGDILRNRVALATVGEYLLRVVPSAAYEPLTPLSVLIAVLVTFGLMEKANEITAMKANGISVYRIVLPVLVLAGVIAGGLFVFEEVYLPDTNKRQEALRNSIKGKPAQTFLRPDRKWIFGRANTIYYYEFFDAYRDTFGNISVFEFDPATFALTKRIFATHAHWENELNKFVFEHGWSRSFQGAAIEQFQTFDVATFSELRESKDYFKKEVKQSSEMNFAELKNYIQDLQQGGFDVVRLKIQLYKKLAYPLITLVMAVLAVPFSLRAARHGALAGVAVALGLAVLYWVTSGLFESLGNVNQLPPALAAWSPDLLFALAGGYLILKVPT